MREELPPPPSIPIGMMSKSAARRQRRKERGEEPFASTSRAGKGGAKAKAQDVQGILGLLAGEVEPQEAPSSSSASEGVMALLGLQVGTPSSFASGCPIICGTCPSTTLQPSPPP